MTNMSNEQENIWKEAADSHCTVMFVHFAVETDKRAMCFADITAENQKQESENSLYIQWN
jgi:hypothetical protein